MLQRTLSIYFIAVYTLLSHAHAAISENPKINNYVPIFQLLYDSHAQPKVAIRSYERDRVKYFLAVDPYSLETQIIMAATTTPISPPEGTQIKQIVTPSSLLEDSPFLTALERYNLPPYKLQNYGATSALYETAGMFLTIDMCPSTKTFEKEFFEELARLQKENTTPAPIAVAVSALWMINHHKEFAWLKEQSALGKLDITWVNHSFSHPYKPSAPLDRNFLLMNEDKFEEEVLQTEIVLLENNLLPSVFFRFPGLVSNENLTKKLNKLSLIPLGSHAWLAKGEKITPGAFILVHGNGNEPEGIRVIMPLLKSLNWSNIQKAFINPNMFHPASLHNN